MQAIGMYKTLSYQRSLASIRLIDQELGCNCSFISSSKHSQPSIDELYRYCDEDLDSTDSDEESDVDYGNDLITFWPLFGF